jgi:hypothetical protein
MDWRRARKPKPAENAIGEGFKRNDGTVTPFLPKDSLAKRAAAAEREWMREGGYFFNKGYIVAPKRPKSG